MMMIIIIILSIILLLLLIMIILLLLLLIIIIISVIIIIIIIDIIIIVIIIISSSSSMITILCLSLTSCACPHLGRGPCGPRDLQRGALVDKFTVPQKGYAKRGSNRQITKTTLLRHF